MIPKIIHQIWIGEEAPQFILDAMKTVKDYNPDYRYILHGNESLEKYNLLHLAGKSKPTYISDILRLKILTEYGGWYIDADVIAYTSLNELPHDNTFNSALLKFGEEVNRKYQNGFLSCKKGFDFSEVLEVYIPDKVMIPLWHIFCEKHMPFEIPLTYFCTDSKYYKDLRMSSWREKLLNEEAYK